HSSLLFFVSFLPPPPRSLPFPYTTLFRSCVRGAVGAPSGGSAEEAIAAHLRGKPAILVLDGFDRLVEAAGLIKRLLEPMPAGERSEEHTSELQSHLNLVCRLLLEKK